MTIQSVTAQLRTTDLAGSIAFWTKAVGLEIEFIHDEFYAGIRAGSSVFHLKLVDVPDPSIAFVEAGRHLHLYLETDDAKRTLTALGMKGIRPRIPLHETDWGTLEFAIFDDQGHTIYFGERL